MDINSLKNEARATWGDGRLTLSEIIVRMGVDFGKLCRWERNADKDRDQHTDAELKRHLGNLLYSLIRWIDDLGYDPEECISLAKDSQKKFADENKNR
jgi:hypothetical protein